MPRRPHALRRLVAALLLGGAVLPMPAAASAASAAAAAQSPGNDPDQEIVVYGTRLFHDIRPERDLDEEAIAGYGVSTIDGLIGEVEAELGESGERPLILVNGERITDPDEIGALPVEALTNVRILPRGSAVRAGGTSGQRVVSLTLKKMVRSATVLAAPKVATEGDYHAGRGEAILTYIRGSTRANVAFRGRGETALLESDRDILQPASALPFALGGNVVGFPNTTGEIDPLLSAVAGQLVTVAPLPSASSPTLADFAAGANQPALTDLGRFRTLRPRTRTYDLNGTFATRLAPWLTSTASLRLSRSARESKRGLPTALFVLSPANAFSPFSGDVGLAFYGPEPLRTRSERDSGEATVTLNGRFGRWTSNLNARYSQSNDDTRSERQGVFGAIPLADSVDPFSGALPGPIAIRTGRATARSINQSTQLSLTGPAATLPAGDLQTSFEGRLVWNRLRSTSSFSLLPDRRRFRRFEQSVRASAEVPLTSRANDVLAALGDISATAEYGLMHFSDAGRLSQHALGLTWEPSDRLRLRGDIERTARPASIQTLGNPIIVTPQVRVFDPITGDTVDVVQITGGNPSLDPEKTVIRRLSASWRAVPRLNLQLNAEYSDTDARNFISSLPEASAAVTLAFPDRFIRDPGGVLTVIDLRPVNFDSHREKRFRYGLSLHTTIGGGQRPAVRAATVDPETGEPELERETALTPVGAARPGRLRPPTRLQLTANHSIVFLDEISIRPGLDSVDLLEGGAIGIAGGRVRHQLDATAGILSRGLGIRTGITWRGPSTLESRIGGTTDTLRFSPLLAVNLRAFADLRRFLPKSEWARGMRLSLNVLNVTNDRQNVRDSFGNTPLQYQPAYRDPIGRTIEVELRKVF